MKKKILAILCAVVCLFSVSCTPDYSGKQIKAENVKNVILLIGDGMGQNQIKAGEILKGEPLFMQGLTQQTKVETSPYDEDVVTDSAAAATAMATGVRTRGGYVGLDKDGNHLESIVDIAKRNGKRTGVISTEELTGATPMGFSSHALNRSSAYELVSNAVASSNVDLFAGYIFSSLIYSSLYEENGYTKVANVDDISKSSANKIFGDYCVYADEPSMQANLDVSALDRLVMESIEWLSKDEDGFFLMAEGAHIDKKCHENNLNAMLKELYAFDDTVKAVVNWASKRNDTVVIVTADHETGGLGFMRSATKENFFEKYWWQTTGHTATPVNLYFYGNELNFEKISSYGDATLIRNVDIFRLMKSYIEP